MAKTTTQTAGENRRFFSAYDLPPSEGQIFVEPSETKQAHKDECDVNLIVARFQTTGMISHFSQYNAQYGEHDGRTFTEAMQLVTNAQQMFDDLPSAAREFFNHDPAQFLDFFDDFDGSNESQVAKLDELGLLDTYDPKGVPGVPPSEMRLTEPPGASDDAPEPVKGGEAGEANP